MNKRDNRKYKAKADFDTLYRKGDIFVIVERNRDERLLPIGAMKLRDNEVYYFEENELEVINGK
jgi:hypothetical protein